jgi:hypothetical protein
MATTFIKIRSMVSHSSLKTRIRENQLVTTDHVSKFQFRYIKQMDRYLKNGKQNKCCLLLKKIGMN